MSPNHFELPPIHKSSKPDPEIWLRMRRYFLDQRATLVQLRKDKNEEDVDWVQAEMLEGLDLEDMQAWERMFVEGRWQNPEWKELVDAARASLGKFLGYIAVPNEDELMDELKRIQRELLGALRGFGGADPTERAVYLGQIFEKVQSFKTLSQCSDDARNLINQITSSIAELAQASKK
jgi:hypothetical protein